MQQRREKNLICSIVFAKKTIFLKLKKPAFEEINKF